MPASRAKQLLRLHSTKDALETEKSITIAQAVKIGISGSTWSIVIEVDKNDALASALALQKSMQENADSMSRLQAILGFIITLIAVFCIWWMTKSIVSPINMLRERMDTLASEDGDLTQKIDVDTHAELIALGNGFNHFLAKLQSLISQLKQLTVKTQAESESTAKISQSIRYRVNGQYNERPL